jgi:hypothetical protein
MNYFETWTFMPSTSPSKEKPDFGAVAISATRPLLSQEQLFTAEAHRQSLAVASSACEAEDQAFVEAIADWS